MLKILVKLFLFLPVPLFVMGLNYFVDPSHLFIRGEYEQGIAHLLLAGKNVADAGNHDDRLVQRYYISELSGKRDVVILGSSRSTFIRASFFPGRSFFNSSVTAATLEDFMAIYGLYRSAGKLPENIIISLDPWILDSGHIYNSFRNWDSIHEEYRAIERLVSPLPETAFDDKMGFNPVFIKQLKSLVSIPYFVQSFKYWIKRKQNRAFVIEGTQTIHGLKLADGSFILDKNGRAITVAQARAKATAIEIREMKAFRIETHRKAMFEGFIRLMMHDGIKVVFFFSPYHPLTYDIISKSTNVDEIQQYFTHFAESSNINIIGSYNPTDIDCKDYDFYDNMHLTRSGIEKVFKKWQNTITSTITK